MPECVRMTRAAKCRIELVSVRVQFFGSGQHLDDSYVFMCVHMNIKDGKV